jgi:hypothetical protein
MNCHQMKKPVDRTNDDDRDVAVETEPQILVRGIDTQQLLEEAAEAVPGDVEREQRRPPMRK